MSVVVYYGANDKLKCAQQHTHTYTHTHTRTHTLTHTHINPAAMAYEPSYYYIEPTEVAALLRGPEVEKTVVIDVRDEDFRGGHIRGAVNIPSHNFYKDERINEIFQQHCSGKEKIIFHCMMSQVRGPKCAGRTSTVLRGVTGKPQIFVMSGGFQRFAEMFEGSELIQH